MGTGFGMMSSPMRPGFGMVSPMGGMVPSPGPAVPAPSLHVGGVGAVNLGTGLGVSGITPIPSQPAASVISTTTPGAVPLQNITPVPPVGGGADPLAVLNDVFVPLDTIQPGEGGEEGRKAYW